MLKSYFARIYEVAKHGDAREESFYSCLEELLTNYTKAVKKKNVHVTTLPKKTEAGNPDFRVWDGKQKIVGYIEAKAPTTKFLDQTEDTPQLKRYLQTFPNLILTNFFEFRLYRDGKLIDSVQIGRPYMIQKLDRVPLVENEADFLKLLEKYFSYSLPKIYTAKTLAIELAKRTRFLKEEVVAEELEEEAKKKKGYILGFYDAFRTYLISGLSKEDFADLYSQTITYGLFAARTRAKNGFNRKLAYDNIPQTIGILRDVFEFISLGTLPQQMEWIIDDIAEVLSVTDVNKILHKYFHEGRGKDPIVHFYETFLAEYDPKMREKRGVYYTPEPVVSYIVRSLNHILKKHFDKPLGFASDSVNVLDPAAGTLTFLAEAAKLAADEFVNQYGEGGKESFIKENILKNFYAFELMMAPYAIGHLKMSFLLDELGYKLQKNDRFKLYLTNTLEMIELAQTDLPGMASLSEESHLAGKVKKEKPILVVLGNPPYSVSSTNKSKFIEGYFTQKEGRDKKGNKRKLKIYIKGIMDDYKEDVKKEKNIQPLSDDYIKFIRFAHWKIDRVGKGLIGLITNNSYLSGLIHRGMRKKLLESFNEIYVLNLHGNSRIGEKCPDGSKDENVFDIMQGVSIVLLIKDKKQKGLGKVFYQDVYGFRKVKYGYLESNDLDSTDWKELQLTEPHYFFVERDFSLQANYDKFISIPEIFEHFNAGTATGKDNILVDFDEKNLRRQFSPTNKEVFYLLMENYGLSKSIIDQWYVEIENNNIKDQIVSYSYRLFDDRFTIYNGHILQRARKSIMDHMTNDNIGLMVTKQLAKLPFQHCFVTNKVSDRCLVSNRSRELGYLFPLYTASDITRRDLFSQAENDGKKKNNIKPEINNLLSTTYQKGPAPEQIFYYIYAILYSNIYRTKYAEFLKINFPSVPFTSDYKLFIKMGEYGKRLVDLHLLKSTELKSMVAKFQGKGNKKVEKLKYDEKENRLYINKEQYFEGVAEEVWQYQIGSYQVCEKWLKDRKRGLLSLDDIKHYCKVVTALQKTIEIQKAIDEIYPDVEKNVINFN